MNFLRGLGAFAFLVGMNGAEAAFYCGPNPCVSVPSSASGYIYAQPGGYRAVTTSTNLTFPSQNTFNHGILDFSITPSVQTVSAVGSATTPNLSSNSVLATLYYNLMVVSTVPLASGTSVPIGIRGDYSLSTDWIPSLSGSGATASAELVISSSDSSFQYLSLNKSLVGVGCTGRCTGSQRDASDFDFTRTIKVGSVLNVTLTAQTSANQRVGLANYSATANAFLDPVFYVSPKITNSSQYAFILSTGVGNGPVTQVPEPAIVIQLIAGLLAVIGLRFKKSGAEKKDAREAGEGWLTRLPSQCARWRRIA